MTDQSKTHHQVNTLNEDFEWLVKARNMLENDNEGSTWKYGKIIGKLSKDYVKSREHVNSK
jgi:hypothetical protein|tara:strand:+ start:109 stop:291 length:183 start_codon:yes stop_codon:yes gene_type:complete